MTVAVATQVKLMTDNSVNTGYFKSKRTELQEMTFLWDCVCHLKLDFKLSERLTFMRDVSNILGGNLL